MNRLLLLGSTWGSQQYLLVNSKKGVFEWLSIATTTTTRGAFLAWDVHDGWRAVKVTAEDVFPFKTRSTTSGSN